MRLRKATFVLLCIPNAVAKVKTYNGGSMVDREDYYGSVGRNEGILDRREGSDRGNIATLHPSPKCWKSAIRIFHHVAGRDSEDAEELCAVLPEAHQKLLALEIARCHLDDLGKELLQGDQQVLAACNRLAENDAVLGFCLKHLTDAGAYSYTHYVSYVQQLCTRLAQEVMLDYQHETQKEMANRYADISVQSIEQMEAIQNLSQRHAEQMQALLEVPDQVMDRLTKELTDQLKETMTDQLKENLKEQLQIQLHEQLEDQLGNLLQHQATEQASFAAQLMDHIEARDSEQKERYNTWAHYQSTMWQHQARELERQRETMEEQRKRMEDLSETVSTTTERMQPLVGLQSLVTAATQGYTWVTFLLHFLATFNIVWLFTRPERCHRFRGYLFGLVLCEAILEVSLTVFVQYNILSQDERIETTMELRRSALALECCTYVVGLIMSFCFSTNESRQTNEIQSMQEMKDRQLEVLKKLEDAATKQSMVSKGPLRAASLESKKPIQQYQPSGAPAPIFTPDQRSDFQSDHDYFRLPSIHRPLPQMQPPFQRRQDTAVAVTPSSHHEMNFNPSNERNLRPQVTPVHQWAPQSMLAVPSGLNVTTQMRYPRQLDPLDVPQNPPSQYSRMMDDPQFPYIAPMNSMNDYMDAIQTDGIGGFEALGIPSRGYVKNSSHKRTADSTLEGQPDDKKVRL